MSKKTASNKQKRKQKFVSSTIQGRMLLQICLYWGVYHLVLFLTMFLFHYVQYRSNSMHSNTILTFGELFNEFSQAHVTLLMSAMAIFPIILWDFFKFSHRIAGPLVRFNNSLKVLAKGETVAPIKLRDGDLLTELQDNFNAYLKEVPSQQSNSELLSADQADMVEQVLDAPVETTES